MYGYDSRVRLSEVDQDPAHDTECDPEFFSGLQQFSF